MLLHVQAGVGAGSSYGSNPVAAPLLLMRSEVHLQGHAVQSPLEQQGKTVSLTVCDTHRVHINCTGWVLLQRSFVCKRGQAPSLGCGCQVVGKNIFLAERRATA